VTATPNAVLDGANLTVAWTVANDGPDTAADGQYTWSDRVVLVNDQGDEIRTLGTFARSLGVIAGGEYSRSETFAAPLLQGTYRVRVTAAWSGNLPDPVAANNAALSDFVTIAA